MFFVLSSHLIFNSYFLCPPQLLRSVEKYPELCNDAPTVTTDDGAVIVHLAAFQWVDAGFHIDKIKSPIIAKSITIAAAIDSQKAAVLPLGYSL